MDLADPARGPLSVLSAHLGAGEADATAVGLLERSPVSAAAPAPRAGALAVVDARTGRRHEVKVSEDGTVRAIDFKKITTAKDDKGLKIYDPGYLNTAPVRSTICYIDGDGGILRYRGYPIEELAESSSFVEVAYLLTGVIGDVLDPFNTSVDLTVLFNGMPIVSGMELRSPTVSERPRVEIGGDDYRVAYTLLMVDPDAPNPSNPTSREYLHWMVTDIPASTDETYGREVVCYEAPNPATGIHRMVLVLFRQLGRETVFAPSRRHNFNTRAFARRYNLGAPVAAMFFNCQRQTGSGGRRFTGPYANRRQAS